jgi:hypothetical protein
MEKIVKRINLAYSLIYTATILATFVGYAITQTTESTIPSPKSELSISLSTLVIAYILISIPAALAIFHRNTKKWAAIEDRFTKINKYVAGAKLRLLVVGLGLVMSVVVFYILRTPSMIFCAGIAAVALLFCRPSENKIISDLKLDEEEDNNND